MILGLASYRLDALVLAVLKDSYAVGIYGLAYRFMEAAIPLGVFIIAAIFPLLVRDEADHERRAAQIARAADLLLVVSVGVAVATVVLAPDLVRLLGGAAYAPSVVPLRILVLSLPFTFVAGLMSWTLIARGLQHRLIPIVAASADAEPRAQPRTRADVLVQGVRRRDAGDEALGAFVLIFLVRMWLGRALPRLAARIALGGALALGGGVLVRLVAGEIVGTVAAVAVFAGLVLAFGLVTRAELDALVRRGGSSGRVSRRRTRGPDA